MRNIIYHKLMEVLSPEYLDVIDDSDAHKGHAGAKPGGGTHFNIIIRAKSLENLGKIDAHRKIYTALGEELKTSIHALSIKILERQ